ncbi:MAG: hypothetical protein JNJ88_11830 [Planctomycetes bacterium]|nr:hypothetical protein [Planctomycetota bacterium]
MFLTPSHAVRYGAAASLLLIPLAGCREKRTGHQFAGSAATSEITGTITYPGGDITVNKTKHVLYGMSVVADEGTVDLGEAVQVRIRPELLPPGPIPSGAVQASRIARIIKNNAFDFLHPLSITLPYDPSVLQVGDEPTPFVWDPATSHYIPLAAQSIDKTANTITFSTVHFGYFVLLGVPGLGTAPSDADTGFRGPVDGFFHPNFGNYVLPGASSLGMASYASWYFAAKKVPTSINLFDKYRQGDPGVFQDDTTARELIGRIFAASRNIWEKRVTLGDSTMTDAQTGLQLLTALKLSTMPPLLRFSGLGGGGAPFSQTVLVHDFDASAGEFHIYDPNFPGEIAALSWSLTSGFTTYTKAAAYPGAITKYAIEACSSVLDSSRFEDYFTAADTNWTDSRLVTVNLTAPVPDASGVAFIIDPDPVNVQGSCSGGLYPATRFVYYINGGMKWVDTMDPASYSKSIPNGSFPNPSNSLIMLWTDNPRNEWNAWAGFRSFTMKRPGQNFFVNLGFETGDFTGWSHETHTWYNTTPGSFLPEKSAIVGAGFDPIASTLAFPYAGSQACRINNEDNSEHISTVSQSAVVPSVPNPQLQFYWAAILEDPSHSPWEQPYVDIVVSDDTAGVQLYQRHFYANDPLYSGWQPFFGGSWKAIPWQIAIVDVSGTQGHTLTIRVTAADCSLGGHGGYAYLDGEE